MAMMSPNSFEAVEITAEQAWFLADYLRAGTYPWKLAITMPYADFGQRDSFNQRCTDDLTATEILDDQGYVRPTVAECIRVVCRPRQWLEWLSMVDEEQVLRGVLARTEPPDAVVALRYAQMVTFTPLQVVYTGSVVPIITTGLADQPPARFDEFVLPMDTGKAIDERVARGADMIEALTELGVPERAAQIMGIARTGKHTNVEITAHEATNGAHHQSDVCINLINTEVGRILVSPPAGEPRVGGESVFAPADPFAVAMAVRDLTNRLPSGTWFPEENFNI
jgi:hypothetical protein